MTVASNPNLILHVVDKEKAEEFLKDKGSILYISLLLNIIGFKPNYDNDLSFLDNTEYILYYEPSTVSCAFNGISNI